MARTNTLNGSKSAPDASDLAAQIDTLKSDLADLTSLIGDMGKAKTESAKEDVQQKLDDMRDAGAAHMADARMHAEELGAQANDFITRQPATALGIAAGVGFLVGMISARK
ncbi:YqjD family protein [Tateyamaria armeniaca]|uniref:YqjD family protein n=1 Tax=Tateyamaria armeniaca TaxID=2518930 RepID=A0ABW8UY65_9RHOB